MYTLLDLISLYLSCVLFILVETDLLRRYFFSMYHKPNVWWSERREEEENKNKYKKIVMEVLQVENLGAACSKKNFFTNKILQIFLIYNILQQLIPDWFLKPPKLILYISIHSILIMLKYPFKNQFHCLPMNNFCLDFFHKLWWLSFILSLSTMMMFDEIFLLCYFFCHWGVYGMCDKIRQKIIERLLAHIFCQGSTLKTANR